VTDSCLWIGMMLVVVVVVLVQAYGCNAVPAGCSMVNLLFPITTARCICLGWM